MNGLSVVMPAFNEAEKISDSIRKSLRIFESFRLPFELIVVNDGSRDRTSGIVRDFSRRDSRVRLVTYRKNQGKGHALKYASSFARMSLVTFVDADLELNPSQLVNFINIMNSSGADVVVGSKRHPESKLVYPWHRKLLSDAYFLFNRVLFGLPVKDTQSGLKLFKKRVVDDVFPRIVVKGYAFDLEVLAVAHKFGYKIVEAPIVLNFSRFKSRVGLRAIRSMFIDTLGILYRFYLLRYYDRKL